MAKSRVNVKDVSSALDRLTKDLKKLQGTPSVEGTSRDAAVLHRRLTTVKALLNDCPDPMFRTFTVETAALRGKVKTGRKTTRKTR